MAAGIKHQLSPRTAPLNNCSKGLILCAIACVVVTLADKSGTVTSTCAYTYLITRIAYIPAHAFGWAPSRSGIRFIGTVAMLIAALL